MLLLGPIGPLFGIWLPPKDTEQTANCQLWIVDVLLKIGYISAVTWGKSDRTARNSRKPRNLRNIHPSGERR